MKIKKNGKVINLTESDVKRIVKRVLSEGESEIIVPISKKDMRQRKSAERKERRDDRRMARKDSRGDATPKEITDFIKNGGSIYNSSNKEVTGDGTSGYKHQSVESDGRVVLGLRKGEGFALVIDTENKKWEIYERGGMSDSWSVTKEGSFMFDGKKIKLTQSKNI
jgi:hypothetical protein